MTDDGVGMHSVHGTTSDGFGSRLVKYIVRQLRGAVSWRPGDPGTVVTVSCPLSSIEAPETDDE